MRSKRAGRWTTHLTLIVLAAIFLTPFYCMVASSLKSDEQMTDTSSLSRILIPDPVQWRNYLNVTKYLPYWRFFANTVYVTVLSIFGALISCPLAAYGFSRLRWPGRDAVFLVLLSTMMLPYQVTMVPQFLIYAQLGWVNSYKPLWVPSFLGVPFFIFLLRQFFMTIPTDLEDAAKIDGCGYLKTYRSIMLPLIKPALATVLVFQLLWAWNDFLGPLIYLHDERLLTLSVGLQALRHQHYQEWALLLAGSTIMTLPIILVFFLGQKAFIEGVTLTGMKT